MTGNLDELPGQLIELRELVREAHGANKDLRAAIKEARGYSDSLIKMVEATADACRTAAHEAGAAQIVAFGEHLQGEMNAAARDLNRAVEAARAHIARSLRPQIAALDPETGTLVIDFAGSLFDADPAGNGGPT
jgi:hypothetical protein